MVEKLCPECLAPLVLHKSSFEQYQPSVYSCDKCKHDFAPPYVEAFMKGFSRRPELDEKSVYQEIVNQSRPPYEQWERILARRICAKFRAPDSSNEQAYEWGYADGKKSVGQPASSVNAQVVEALEALLVAVCYKTPTVDFGTKKEPNPCYEARVPVQFVHDAHKALTSIKAGKDTKCS